MTALGHSRLDRTFSPCLGFALTDAWLLASSAARRQVRRNSRAVPVSTPSIDSMKPISSNSWDLILAQRLRRCRVGDRLRAAQAVVSKDGRLHGRYPRPSFETPCFATLRRAPQDEVRGGCRYDSSAGSAVLATSASCQIRTFATRRLIALSRFQPSIRMACVDIVKTIDVARCHLAASRGGTAL
jgi:hypothetical protein